MSVGTRSAPVAVQRAGALSGWSSQQALGKGGHRPCAAASAVEVSSGGVPQNAPGHGLAGCAVVLEYPVELTSGSDMPQPKTVTIRKLREANFEAIDLVVKQLRAVGADDDTIVSVLKERFTEPATVQSAVLKALGGYKQPARSTVEKHRGQLPNSVGGAVAGALIRGGLVSSVEKSAFGPGPDERIAKARKQLDTPDTGAAHDLTNRIRKNAEKAKSS